jgi:CheY-like chemotaxis protein
MGAKVIVVDDIHNAAVEYARLIKIKTSIEVVATDDPDEAIKIVKSNPIRVAILDQRMPKKSGTALFQEIRHIDPSIKAIMLTGEAAPHEVGEALSIGFSDYLHKSNVEKLPSQVLLYYAQYEVDIAKKSEGTSKVRLYKERKGIIFGKVLEYTIEASQVMDEEFIFPNSWVTTKQLNVGEQTKEVDKVEITQKFVYETEGELKTSSKIGLDLSVLPKLKNELEVVISSKFKEHIFSESKRTFEVVREYKLPQEPVNPGDLHVVSRHFQRAPVYRAIRCLLLKTCKCCGSGEPHVIMVYQLTSKIATQQCDFLSDKTSRKVPTGIDIY